MSNIRTGQITSNSEAWSSWTPTIAAASGSITTVSASGRYTQIGKTVSFHVNITITTNGTGAGALTMTLPVTAQATNNANVYGREDAVAGKMIQGTNPTTGLMNLYNYDNTYPGSNGAIIRVSGTYEAA